MRRKTGGTQNAPHPNALVYTSHAPGQAATVARSSTPSKSTPAPCLLPSPARVPAVARVRMNPAHAAREGFGAHLEFRGPPRRDRRVRDVRRAAIGSNAAAQAGVREATASRWQAAAAEQLLQVRVPHLFLPCTAVRVRMHAGTTARARARRGRRPGSEQRPRGLRSAIPFSGGGLLDLRGLSAVTLRISLRGAPIWQGPTVGRTPSNRARARLVSVWVARRLQTTRAIHEDFGTVVAN